MRSKLLTTTALSAALLLPTFARAATFSITLVKPTINYPAAGVDGTRAAGINNANFVDFSVHLKTDNSTRLGIIQIGGSPIPPVLDPDSAGFTTPAGINNANQIVGQYLDAGNITHGFIYDFGSSSFTNFDVTASGATGTILFGINDFGDKVGFYFTSTFATEPFVVSGGVENDFAVPDALGAFAEGINNSGNIVGASSTTETEIDETTCRCSGFLRSGIGTFSQFNLPGSSSTIPKAINNNNVVVGRYYDTRGALHGFVYFTSSGTSFTYDYPGQSQTSLNGINDSNLVAGRYVDSGGKAHSFVGRITRTGS